MTNPTRTSGEGGGDCGICRNCHLGGPCLGWPEEADRSDAAAERAAEWEKAALFHGARADEEQAQREDFQSALATIIGPEDRGPWIEVYRAAGGGYEGLQAVAQAALDKWMVSNR